MRIIRTGLIVLLALMCIPRTVHAQPISMLIQGEKMEIGKNSLFN